VLRWTISEKALNLRYNWKIARNESFTKNNFFIEVSSGNSKGIGEVAPNIRYNETSDNIQKEFSDFLNSHPEDIKNIDQLIELLKKIKMCNSLRFGIESAYIHFFCNQHNKDIYEFLKISKPSFIHTSYTIPIMPPGDVKTFIEKHNLKIFKSLKIKINTEGLDLIDEVSKYYKGPVRVDANEAWKDVEALLLFLEKIKSYNIEFIEQPLPYNLVEEYIHLKKHSPFELMGDESITDSADLSLLSKQFHGINMKLMKAGGYLNGINILRSAREYGMKTMIGCMVETTLGISSGMHLCALADYVDLDGFFVIEKEPFGLVKEVDGNLEFNY
jgi:L-Ala-D/L-Glu epimerase